MKDRLRASNVQQSACRVIVNGSGQFCNGTATLSEHRAIFISPALQNSRYNRYNPVYNCRRLDDLAISRSVDYDGRRLERKLESDKRFAIKWDSQVIKYLGVRNLYNNSLTRSKVNDKNRLECLYQFSIFVAHLYSNWKFSKTINFILDRFWISDRGKEREAMLTA